MNFYQWTGSPEILRVKPNGDFELANGVDPLVALGQLSKAFMKQQDRIKRLEEALDLVIPNCSWVHHSKNINTNAANRVR